MVNASTAQVSFTQGELSKNMRGRFDVPQYFAGAERIENFITQTQGPAKYRTGFRFVKQTKNNAPGVLLRFEFNDEQAYGLEFTALKLRFYVNEGILIEATQNITNVTQANPAVVTINSHGYANGDEVIINDVVGMTELNGETFTVANVTANTFELSGIDSTGFAAYTSGGTAAKIVEVDTPYTAAQIDELQTAQNQDTLYIANSNHEPRLLTRTTATSFTLTEHVFDDPPFDAENTTSTTITPSATTGSGITLTASAATFVSTDVGRYVRVDEGSDFGYARITAFTSTTVVTADVEDDFVSNTAQSTWRLGSFSDTTGFPRAVTFYEQRLIYGGTTSRPQTLFFSEAGNFNNYNTGTEASDALQYTIGSRDVNLIRFLVGMQDQLLIGTFGSNFIAKSGQNNEPITPTDISVRPADGIGSENQIPILHNNEVIFTERGQRTLRSFRFSVLKDSFESDDLNLFSQDITIGNVKQIAFQTGRPEIVWCVKNDGELIGLTYKPEQEVRGWHRHNTRTGDEFISITTLPRSGNFDQLWAIVKRTVNGSTNYYVEFQEDFVDHSELLDFFTSIPERNTNVTNFTNKILEEQKEYMYLDSILTFDGSLLGLNASATLTPSATTGNDIVFTASSAVFSSTDVGRQLWNKSVTGVETGRAQIITFTSSTVVRCNILVDFNTTSAIAAGNWYLTANTVTGIDHLNGETVQIITDGSVHPNKTVTSDAITLDYQSSVVHVGLSYTGIIKTMNLEVGGVAGPSQNKYKNIYRAGVKFIDTLSGRFGSSVYNTEGFLFRNTNSLLNNPPLLFTGTKDIAFNDSWQNEKNAIVVQDLPLPCNVEQIVTFANTAN